MGNICIAKNKKMFHKDKSSPFFEEVKSDGSRKCIQEGQLLVFEEHVCCFCIRWETEHEYGPVQSFEQNRFL